MLYLIKHISLLILNENPIHSNLDELVISPDDRQIDHKTIGIGRIPDFRKRIKDFSGLIRNNDLFGWVIVECKPTSGWIGRSQDGRT